MAYCRRPGCRSFPDFLPGAREQGAGRSLPRSEVSAHRAPSSCSPRCAPRGLPTRSLCPVPIKLGPPGSKAPNGHARPKKSLFPESGSEPLSKISAVALLSPRCWTVVHSDGTPIIACDVKSGKEDPPRRLHIEAGVIDQPGTHQGGLPIHQDG